MSTLLANRSLKERDLFGRFVASVSVAHFASTTEETSTHFANAIRTWIDRPHVINKRLVGRKSIWEKDPLKLGHVDEESTLIHPVDLDLVSIFANHDTPARDAVQSLFSTTGFEKVQDILRKLTSLTNQKTPFDVFNVLHFDELVGKRDGPNVFQLSGSTKEDHFWFLCFGRTGGESSDSWLIYYDVSLESSETGPSSSEGSAKPFSICLTVVRDPGSPAPFAGPTPAWLEKTLLENLAKWTKTPTGPSSLGPTLRLVGLETYATNYARLKTKYGLEFAKNWSEVTDPQKFVYEDVAIAAYLLTLWQEDVPTSGKRSVTPKDALDPQRPVHHSSKPRFVDLGCGNGLLVHILSQEGFSGYGIDVRKRKIWERFPSSTDLREMAVVPSDSQLFPDADWLIGNHSDELTPWIPIMAARSSSKTNFFLLPCCFWDLDKKFVRRTSLETQYRSYLNYVSEVISVAGFDVEEDVLRIPSTKRVCLIGRSRNYDWIRETEKERERVDFIRERTAADRRSGDEPVESSLETSPKWSAGFHPRDRVERVRNGTTLDKELRDFVVDTTALSLLDKGVSADKSESWAPGGEMSLPEVAALFTVDILKSLKRECGGLKTMLKNRRQVFVVVGNDVRIRDWRRIDDAASVAGDDRRAKWMKTSLCWFYDRHPRGCPLADTDCLYAHGDKELRIAEK